MRARFLNLSLLCETMTYFSLKYFVKCSFHLPKLQKLRSNLSLSQSNQFTVYLKSVQWLVNTVAELAVSPYTTAFQHIYSW